MPAEFYTERDIVDLVRAGQRRLELGERDRLTDLARERAEKEGLRLVGAYKIPEQAAREAAATRYAVKGEGASPPVEGSAERKAPPDLRGRVHKAVRDRLGEAVEADLIDRVIDRVLDQLGVG